LSQQFDPTGKSSNTLPVQGTFWRRSQAAFEAALPQRFSGVHDDLGEIMDKYFGAGKMVDFSWDNPLRAFICTGVGLFVATYIVGWLMWAVASGVVMMSSPGLYGEVQSAVMDGVDGNAELAKELTAVNWPGACGKAEDGSGGAGAADCTAALEQRANKTEIQAIIANLQGLNISNATVVEAHDDYGDDYEKSGWNNFSGGGQLQGSVGRPDSLVQAKNALATAKPESALGLGGLQALAGAAVAHKSGQADAADGFQESMESLVYKKASRSTKALGFVFLFFIIVGSLLKLRNACSGYTRMGVTLLTAFVIILVVSKGGKGALKELSLAGASGGTFDTLLGPFAAVLSQILVFIQKLVIVVQKLNWEFLVLAATFWLVVSNGSKWAFFGGVYILLTYNAWLGFLLDGGNLAFSPFNVDAFDASFILPPLVWALEVAGMVVGLYLLLGAWRHIGQPAIDKVGELCDAHCGDGSSAAPAAPAPPSAPPAPSAPSGFGG
jgi:hypothetical protein